MFIHKKLLATAMMAACAAVYSPTAPAQAMTVQTSVTGGSAGASAPSASRLADAYSTAFGSRANAISMIEGMRAGKDATVGDQTVTGTGSTMGYGNIDIALSLAKAEAGASPRTADFLASLDKVMDMRASGMGWGQIAHDLGINLGQVMGNAKAGGARAPGANAGKAGSSASATLADHGKENAQGRGSGGAGGGLAQGGNNSGGNNGGGGGNDGGGGGGGGGRK